jgi:hypothetical protein
MVDIKKFKKIYALMPKGGVNDNVQELGGLTMAEAAKQREALKTAVAPVAQVSNSEIMAKYPNIVQAGQSRQAIREQNKVVNAPTVAQAEAKPVISTPALPEPTTLAQATAQRQAVRTAQGLPAQAPVTPPITEEYVAPPKTGILKEGEKFVARTGLGLAQSVVDTLKFGQKYLVEHPTPPNIITAVSPKLQEMGTKITDKLRPLEEQNIVSQWQKSLDKISQQPYFQPSQEWQDSTLKEKVTTKLPETIATILPSVVSSIAPYFIPGVGIFVGAALNAGTVAEDVRQKAVSNGVEEKKAEALGLGTGLIVGAIDRIVPAKAFNKVVDKSLFSIGFVKRLLSFLATGAKEAGTEVVQEGIQMSAEETFRKDLGYNEVATRIAMSALGGFLGGTTMGAMVDVGNRLQKDSGVNVSELITQQFRTAYDQTTGALKTNFPTLSQALESQAGFAKIPERPTWLPEKKAAEGMTEEVKPVSEETLKALSPYDKQKITKMADMLASGRTLNNKGEKFLYEKLKTDEKGLMEALSIRPKLEKAEQKAIDTLNEAIANAESLATALKTVKEDKALVPASRKALIEAVQAPAKEIGKIADIVGEQRKALRTEIEERSALISKLKESKTSIDEVKSALVSYITKNIPKQDIGKRTYLDAVRKTETKKELIKQFARVDNHLTTISKKSYINEINKVFDKANKSAVMDVAEKLKMQGLKKEIDMYVKLNNVSDMDERKLADYFISLNGIAEKGMELGKAKDEFFKLKQELSIQEIVNADLPKPRNPKEFLINPIEKEPFNNFAKRKSSEFLRIVMRFNDRLNPIWYIFNEIDGGKEFKGTVFKTIKKPIDSGFNKQLDMYLSTSEPGVEIIRKYHLDKTNFNRIGIKLNMENSYNKEVLLNDWTEMGFSPEQIEKMSSVELTEREQKLYDFMKAVRDELPVQLEPFVKNVLNKPFVAVKNYWPLIRDYSLYDSTDVVQRELDMMTNNFSPYSSKVPEGTIKTRKGGFKHLELDAWKAFTTHLKDASRILHEGQPILQARNILSDPRVVEKLGTENTNLLLRWVDTMARGGGINGAADWRILDEIRSKMGMGLILWNPELAAIQYSAVNYGIAEIGARNVFRGGKEIWDNPMAWEHTFKHLMPEIHLTSIDDPAFAEIFEGDMGTLTDEKAKQLVRFGDNLARRDVAAGAYMKYCKENNIPIEYVYNENGVATRIANPSEDALAYAMYVVNKTQGSSIYKEIPQLFTRGLYEAEKDTKASALLKSRSLAKTYFFLANYALKSRALMKEAEKNIFRKGKRGKALRTFLAVLIEMYTNAYLYQTMNEGRNKLIAEASGTDYNYAKQPKTLKSRIMNDLFRTRFPIGNILYNTVRFGDTGGEPLSTITDAFANTIKATYNVVAGNMPTKELKGAYAKAVGDIAKLSGYPLTANSAQIIEEILYNKDLSPEREKALWKQRKFPKIYEMQQEAEKYKKQIKWKYE